MPSLTFTPPVRQSRQVRFSERSTGCSSFDSVFENGGVGARRAVSYDDEVSIKRVKTGKATQLLNEAEIKLKAATLSFEKVTAEANEERSVMAAQLSEVKRTLQVCRLDPFQINLCLLDPLISIIGYLQMFYSEDAFVILITVTSILVQNTVVMWSTGGSTGCFLEPGDRQFLKKSSANDSSSKEHHLANGRRGLIKSMDSVYSARRCSCELVNTPLPCVNKAIHHIKKLEGKTKEWYVEDIEQKRSVSWASCVNNEDELTNASAESPILHIKGVGLFDKGKFSPGADISLKLDAEAVILEVIKLIWRLESDRQEAEEALKLEKKRKQGLLGQIDVLSLWKLHNLPEAVQKEYDACAQDFTELRWHISCKKQELDAAQEKAGKTQAVNTRLQEEIVFIEKHRPLLDEKLNHEGDDTAKIRQAQAEATQLLNEAEIKLKAATLSFEKVTAEANEERSVMAAQLSEVKRTLQVCRDNLSHSENIWAKCSSDLMDTDRKIEESKKLYSELITEKQQLTESEISWSQQETNLKYELDDQEKKNKHLTNVYDRLSQEAKKMESDIQSQLSDLEQLLHNKLHALRDLEYENKTLTLENEDLSKKISNSYKTRGKLDADIQRMKKSCMKNEEQMTKVYNELSQVSITHLASKSKLAELEEKSSKEEKRLKNLADSFRKQIIEEVRISQNMQARINALLADREQKEKENNKMKEELMKMMEEIECPVANLESKIRKLTEFHARKSQELWSIRQKKEQCDENFSKNRQHLDYQKSKLEQQLNDIQMKISEVSEELKNTIESVLQFQKSTQDLMLYGNVIQNTMKSTQKTIVSLEQNYNLQELQLDNVRDSSTQLLKEAELYTQRMKREDEDYNLQLQIRQKMHKESIAALEASLKENTALAKEYKTFQVNYLDEKDKLMVNYETRLRIEATIRDYLQISVLQSRMHRALVEFFKQRGLYNQAGLAHFQATSQENAQKILAVQEEMSKTIQHISAFLTSLTDGSPREDGKENKQSISRAETKDRESHTVHITV
ncbi:coiled-coil domain-containing protein 178 [Mantella aurantiaca]